jgi:hypothetical protein
MQCVILLANIENCAPHHEKTFQALIHKKQTPASMALKTRLMDSDLPLFFKSGILFDPTNEQSAQRHLLQPSSTSRHALMGHKLRLLLALDF